MAKVKFFFKNNKPNFDEKKICTVDSYLSTGKELTIDVAKEGSYYIPHIGYNGNTPKKPRYAYLKNAETFYTSNSITGVDSSDKYTGIWETTLIPTTSKLTNDNAKRRINVGVWKADVGNDKGKRVASNYSDDNYTFTPGTSSAAKGSGTCYGNGTDNAVLGYGVIHSSTQDYVETAQMR